MMDVGEVVYWYGMEMLCVEQQFREEFYSEEIEGWVCLGIFEDLAIYYLFFILVCFWEQYLCIQFFVECDLMENFYKNFKVNEYELVIFKYEQFNVVYFDCIVKIWYDLFVWVGRSEEECNVWQFVKYVFVIVLFEFCVYWWQVLY